MGSAGLSAFIDAIYEAAAVPEFWPRVLDQLSQLARAEGTVLLTADSVNYRSVASPRMHEHMLAYVAGGWAQKNTRLPRLLARHYAGFLRDVDVYAPEEIECDPVITQFLRPAGLGWAAGTLIQAPGGDTLVFSIERRFEDGPIEAELLPYLDELRPHLARAALWSGRLALERARSAAEALALVGLPAAVLGQRFRIAAANRLLEEMIPSIFLDSKARLMLAQPAADALMLDALNRITANNQGGVRSIPLQGDGPRQPMIVHVIPVSGAAHDVFAMASALIVVSRSRSTELLPSKLLEGLFDLSPAEARVARQAGAGHSVDEVALILGVSRETVRSHLKKILLKTGTRRQAELVRLLGFTGRWTE